MELPARCIARSGLGHPYPGNGKTVGEMISLREYIVAVRCVGIFSAAIYNDTTIHLDKPRPDSQDSALQQTDAINASAPAHLYMACQLYCQNRGLDRVHPASCPNSARKKTSITQAIYLLETAHFSSGSSTAYSISSRAPYCQPFLIQSTSSCKSLLFSNWLTRLLTLYA